MTTDGRQLSRAIEKLQKQNEERHAEFLKRRERIYLRLPRIKEIDRLLTLSVIKAAAAALESGGDPQRAVEAAAEENLELQAEKAELLVAAGCASDALDDKPSCARCGDRGFVNGKLCACLEKLVREEQRTELSQLLKLGEETFDSFDPDWYGDEGNPDRVAMEMVYEICLSYARRFGSPNYKYSNLLFTGGPGLGKTFLSTCIAREVSERGASVVYDTAISIFERFERRKFARDMDAEVSGDIERYMDCDLLILDDLGTEMTTAFTQSTFYDILNSRLVRGKKTIISTNLTPNDIKRRYLPQIYSRINGEFTIVYFKGRDIREQKREKREK